MIKILKDMPETRAQMFSVVEKKVDVTAIVKEIIGAVRKDGDEALKAYAKKFDGATLDTLRVTQAEIDEAVKNVEPEFLEILQKRRPI